MEPSPTTSLDPDARDPLREFTPTRHVVVYWTVFGSALALVAAFAFGLAYAAGTGQADVGFQIDDASTTLLGGLVTLILVVVVLGLHEAIHAAVIRYFGGDVSVGLGVAQFVLPYAYVTTTQRLGRNEYVVVALAPLVLITAGGVPLMVALEAPVLILPLALNVGGAVGDLWMVGILLRYPAHVVVQDSKAGMRIYGEASDERPPAGTGLGFLRRLAYGSALGFGVLMFATFTTLVVLGFSGGPSVALVVPYTSWTLFAFEHGSDGVATTINAAGFGVVSLLFGTAYAVLAPSRTP